MPSTKIEQLYNNHNNNNTKIIVIVIIWNSHRIDSYYYYFYYIQFAEALAQCRGNALQSLSIVYYENIIYFTYCYLFQTFQTSPKSSLNARQCKPSRPSRPAYNYFATRSRTHESRGSRFTHPQRRTSNFTT